MSIQPETITYQGQDYHKRSFVVQDEAGERFSIEIGDNALLAQLDTENHEEDFFIDQRFFAYVDAEALTSCTDSDLANRIDLGGLILSPAVEVA